MSYNAKSIEVLEGLEPVRVRPGMYIGSTSTKGLKHLIYEIVDNSVDEHLAGYCSTIHIELNAEGALCDVAPTILQIMGIEQPKEMTGRSMLKVPAIVFNSIAKLPSSSY